MTRIRPPSEKMLVRKYAQDTRSCHISKSNVLMIHKLGDLHNCSVTLFCSIVKVLKNLLFKYRKKR
jgi:hypothetical protein